MQAKDIPEMPILRLLAGPDVGNLGASRFDIPGELPCLYGLSRALPDATPEKVALAKMRSMIKRGLVQGCCCGCRGDFTITDKGRAILATPQPAPPTTPAKHHP